MRLGKYFTVIFLGLLCVVTIFSGLWFSGYSISKHNSLLVMGNKIPGFIFGFAVVYIGVRSIIKLFRLANQLKKPNMVFSWHNFIK